MSAVSAIVISTLRLIWLAAHVFFALCIVLLGSLFRAIRRDALIKPVEDISQLELPLLAARLADLPYHADSSKDVAASIATLLYDSSLLHFETQELMHTNAVWFLCEGKHSADSELALFIVFRGTMSPTDAIADILFRPEAGPNGVLCHGGFLRTLKHDTTLHDKLKAVTSAKQYTHTYILGHSLGGALSQVLAGAGFLPTALSTTKLTILSLGSPVAFYGEPDASKFDAPTAGARVVSIVHANDVVPRLLGCPLSFARRILTLFAASNSPKKQREHAAVLETLERYVGLPNYELLFFHSGTAYNVSQKERHLVLHLAESLHPRAITDHLSYVCGVECAAHVTSPWKPTLIGTGDK